MGLWAMSTGSLFRICSSRTMDSRFIFRIPEFGRIVIPKSRRACSRVILLICSAYPLFQFPPECRGNRRVLIKTPSFPVIKEKTSIGSSGLMLLLRHRLHHPDRTKHPRPPLPKRSAIWLRIEDPSCACVQGTEVWDWYLPVGRLCLKCRYE